MDDRYTILDFVDSGSMAQVYRANDESLGREVALKVLREAYASDEEFVERFAREAQCAACLQHPNIISVYDQGILPDGRRYIAMEYVCGGSLANRIAQHGPLTIPEAAEIARQIASALEAAHARGIFHRDIKPHNILLTGNGEARVADFGIARAAAAASISGTNRVMGTARYMSPGQSMGKPFGPCDDLYALGVVLYEMLTGEVPFDGESPVAIAHKHVSEPPRPPSELNTGVTEEMETMIIRLLSKAPEDRYASAADLVKDLGRVRDGLAPVGCTAARRRGRSRRRKRALLTLAPVAVLALLGALLAGLAHGPGKGGIIGSLEGPLGRSGSGESGLDNVLGGVRGDVGQTGQTLFGQRQTIIPDVEGLPEQEARQRLAERGFGAEVRLRESSQKNVGKVLEQSAPAGTEAQQGARLLLAIGKSVAEGRPAESGSGSDGQLSVEAPESVAHDGRRTSEQPDPESGAAARFRPSAASPAAATSKTASGHTRPEPVPSQSWSRDGQTPAVGPGEQEGEAAGSGKSGGFVNETSAPRGREGVLPEPTVSGVAQRTGTRSSGQSVRDQATGGRNDSNISSAAPVDGLDQTSMERDHLYPKEGSAIPGPSTESSAGAIIPGEISGEGTDNNVEGQYVPAP